MLTFIEEFHNRLTKYDQLKIHFSNTTYDTREISRAIFHHAAMFQAYGIGEGCRVAVISDLHPQFIFGIFGLMYLGAIPVVLDRYLNAEVLVQLAQDEQCIFTDRYEAYTNSKVIYLDNNRDYLKNIPSTYGSFTDSFPLHTPFDQTVIILQSSGTTGLPKKVLYSNSNLLWAVNEYQRIYKLQSHHVIANALPAHYSLGLIACTLVPMFHQKEIVISPFNNLDTMLQEIEQFQVQILPTFPVTYKKLAKMDLTKYDLSSLKICDSGGEPLPMPIIKKLSESSGIIITEGYGLTETSSLSHFLLPDEKGELRLGSVGQPCTDVKCKIINEIGEESGINELGELYVKGPLLMQGYDQPNLEETVFTRDGWFKTGDIFFRDEDNYYYFCMRKKDLGTLAIDIAKQFRQVEDTLYSISHIEEIFPLLHTEGYWILLVKPTEPSSISTDVLTQMIMQNANIGPIDIRTIKFVHQLPRTTSGKVERRALGS